MCCAMRCYAMLRTTEDSQLFCGPVDWLQDCGVAFMGESRGLEGVFGRSIGRSIEFSMPRATLLFRASRALCAVDVNHYGRAGRSHTSASMAPGS